MQNSASLKQNRLETRMAARNAFKVGMIGSTGAQTGLSGPTADNVDAMAAAAEPTADPLRHAAGQAS